MPTTQVDVHELPARFTEILAQAAAGTEVIVTDGSIPRAKLLPFGRRSRASSVFIPAPW